VRVNNAMACSIRLNCMQSKIRGGGGGGFKWSANSVFPRRVADKYRPWWKTFDPPLQRLRGNTVFFCRGHFAR
jgi:hypothetical protein